MKNRIEKLYGDLKTAGTFKFLVHEEKGDWFYKSTDILLNGLAEELEELEDAVKDGNKERALSEIGDCANYLIMLLEKVQNGL